MSRGDGIFKRRYRDRKGEWQTSPFWWFRDPVSGKQVSSRKRDKTAAKLLKADRERLHADPEYAAAHAATVGQWAAKLIAHKRKRKAQGTAHMYTVKIGHVVRLLGEERKLVTINPALVDWFVETREAEGAGASTIGKELTALAQMLKLANREGCYSRDVRSLRPVSFSTGYVPGTRVLTWAEIDQLEATEPAEKFAAIFAIVASSCRDSELKSLQPESYDRQTGLLHIRGTKTAGSDRTVPIASIFRERFERAVLPHLPVRFKDPSRLAARACERAGMAHASSNDLRRTCATMLAAAGVPLDVAAQVLGHVNSDMLKRVYVKLAPAQLQALVERGIASSVQQTEPETYSDCVRGECGYSCFSAGGPSEGRTRTLLRAEDFKATRYAVRGGYSEVFEGLGSTDRGGFEAFGASVQQTRSWPAVLRIALESRRSPEASHAG